jgi:hypothetical protein
VSNATPGVSLHLMKTTAIVNSESNNPFGRVLRTIYPFSCNDKKVFEFNSRNRHIDSIELAVANLFHFIPREEANDTNKGIMVCG